ncbi:MAG: hypothetical protein HRU38_08075 [Saccharospirillaceae bacterium]|nr:hypothetical protein [Pseudomonadales bacterium]NRB78610.1 hypothetical protein [Saccharospirillaceae bacterium]
MQSTSLVLSDFIKHPQLIIGVFVVLLVNLLVVFLLAIPSFQALKNQQNSHRQTVLELLSEQIAPLLVNRDSVSLSNMALNIIERPLISELQIFDNKTRVIAKAKQRKLLTNTVLIKNEITFLNQIIGEVNITYDDQLMPKYLNKLITLFLVFNVLTLGFIISLVYKNDLKNRQKLLTINHKLASVLQDWQPKTGTQLQQIEQIIHTIETNKVLSVSQSIIEQKQHLSFLKMMQQWRNISDKGFYTELCLLNVRCVNSDALSRQFDAYTLNYLWESYEFILHRLTQLYRAIQLPEGSMLAFGMEDDSNERDIELETSNSVCAAKVFEQALEILKEDENLNDLQRELFKQAKFAITISFGMAFVATTSRLGINLPMVAGDVYNDIQSIASTHVGGDIWVNSELFANQSIGEIVDASVVRNTIRFDGSEIEIWQLDDAKKSYFPIFKKQAQTILSKYHGK